MQKKEKILTAILAVLFVVFALIALYYNVLMPKARSVQVDRPIQLNNTLKTSVTVLPAPAK
jgi:preprotein translocase subunit SecG